MVIDPQEHFGAAVLVDYVVLKAFAAQMHVGEKAQQGSIAGKSALHFDTKVVGPGRNNQRMIVQLQRDHSLAGRALCENHSDRCLILSGGSVGGVMHLEDEIGTGG